MLRTVPPPAAYKEGQQWPQVLSLLTEMQQHPAQPDVLTHNDAVSTCEKGRQWLQALNLMTEMR